MKKQNSKTQKTAAVKPSNEKKPAANAKPNAAKKSAKPAGKSKKSA